MWQKKKKKKLILRPTKLHRQHYCWWYSGQNDDQHIFDPQKIDKSSFKSLRLRDTKVMMIIILSLWWRCQKKNKHFQVVQLDLSRMQWKLVKTQIYFLTIIWEYTVPWLAFFVHENNPKWSCVEYWSKHHSDFRLEDSKTGLYHCRTGFSIS